VSIADIGSDAILVRLTRSRYVLVSGLHRLEPPGTRETTVLANVVQARQALTWVCGGRSLAVMVMAGAGLARAWRSPGRRRLSWLEAEPVPHHCRPASRSRRLRARRRRAGSFGDGCATCR